MEFRGKQNRGKGNKVEGETAKNVRREISGQNAYYASSDFSVVLLKKWQAGPIRFLHVAM